MRKHYAPSTPPSKRPNLLVVGSDLVSLAASARKAGYNVYSVDYFGDTDLKTLCRESLSIVTQKRGRSSGRISSNFKPESFIKLIEKISKKHEIDAALLGSGLEDFPQVISYINDRLSILGNKPNRIRGVRDKEQFFQGLNELGIPGPRTAIVECLEEAKKKAIQIGYPLMLKPEAGFGGFGLRKTLNANELEAAFREVSSISRRVLIQEFIPGIPASASLISIPGEALTLTINKQLLGKPNLGQREPFGYCGNIVPLSASKSVIERCKTIAEKVVIHSGLIGSNGVDFIIAQDSSPRVVEVNPRFQGTLECIERVLRINVVKAHIEACSLGILPKAEKVYRCFCTRLVLFAPQRSKIPNLNSFSGIRDIPPPGIIVEDGEPLCSIIAEGSSYTTSLINAKRVAGAIFKQLQRAT